MTCGNRTCRMVAVAAAVLVIGSAIPDRAFAQSTPGPTFDETGCARIRLSPEVAPRVRCGTVEVPRDYARPERGRFKLAVVVVRSATQPAKPDADLYISGGPGSPLTVYADAQAKRPLAPDRDLVLVDQRGTGASEPAICPDLDRDLVSAVATDPADEGRRRAVYAACRTQAVAAGIDLRDFGTTVTVDDFERVRRSLGIARWNVFGVSYGTTVAMTMLALHPESIRAAVLDSVYPPDPILPPWPVTSAEARDAFLADCGRDDGCRAVDPDLSETYRDTLKRLAEKPLVIPFPHGMRRPDDRGLLSPSLFAFVVARLVYYPNFYPGLPRLISAVHDGRTDAFAATLASLFAAESDPTTGSRLSLRAAVDCRDRPRYRGAPPAGDISDMTSLVGICDDWAPLGPPPLVPRDTHVPTLVLAGRFDPNAPLAESRRVAEMIGGQARWIEVMGMGHSVRAFSPCAAGIVSAFIENPDRAPDTACADRAPPISFLPLR